MTESQRSAIIILPECTPPFDTVNAQIEAACDLNDLKYSKLDLELSPTAMDLKIAEADIIIADFSHASNTNDPDYRILAIAGSAALNYGKPVAIIYHGSKESCYYVGWKEFKYITEYEISDVKSLKKKLAKILLEFDELFERGGDFYGLKPKTDTIKIPKTESQRRKGLGIDESIGNRADKKAADMAKLDKQLKERFRKQMVTQMNKTQEEIDAEKAAEAEEKHKVLEAQTMLRAPQQPDPSKIVPKGMRRIAEEIKGEMKTEEMLQKQSYLMKLQEKKQKLEKGLVLDVEDEEDNIELNFDANGDANPVADFVANDEDVHLSQIEQERENEKPKRFGLGLLIDKRTGRKLLLKAKILTGGRSPDNNILIADRLVSKTHFKIFRGGDKAYYIEDMSGSGKNGTFVQSQRVYTRLRLNDGDKIQIAISKRAEKGVRSYIFRQAEA